MIQDGWWDLWIFIAYISIPLEITMVAFRLHGQIFVGKLTMVKVVLVCVAVLFVAFIVACGITHFLSFLHMVECESSIGPTLEYCATMTTTGFCLLARCAMTGADAALGASKRTHVQHNLRGESSHVSPLPEFLRFRAAFLRQFRASQN
eukprot:3340969-Rhodomonas_salina.1